MLFENGDWRADLSGGEDSDDGDDGDGEEFDLTELKRETDALEKTDVPTKVYPAGGR